MDAILTAIEKHPHWIPTLMSVGATIWMARQWVKAIERNHDLGSKFASGQEASNQRLERIEKLLENGK